MKIVKGKLQKWSLARCQNVNTVYNLFFKNNSLIERIDDGKDFNLVLLREDYLKTLTGDDKNLELHRENLKEIIKVKNELVESLRDNIKILNTGKAIDIELA